MRTRWTIEPLEKVSREVTDGSHYSPKTVDTGYPYVTVRDIDGDKINFDSCRFVSKRDFDQLVRNGCKPDKGDILFSKDGTVGKVALVDHERDFVVLSSLAIVRPDSRRIDPMFLSYVMRSPPFLERAIGNKTGVAIRRIILRSLKAIPVPVPPLMEQRRMVQVLNQACGSVTTAQADVETTLKEVRTLFQSYLQAIFTKCRNSCEQRRLGELATFRNGINFTRSSRGESVQIVGVKDFQENFWAPLEALDTVTTDGKLADLDALQENDLLFVRSNGNLELIGRCVLIGPVARRIAHSGFTIRARLNGDRVIPKYLCHFLKWSETRRQMIDSGIGANIKSLNQGALSSLLIPLPSYAEQAKIVEQLDVLDQQTKRLEIVYQRKLALLGELKNSILDRAFNGAL